MLVLSRKLLEAVAVGAADGTGRPLKITVLEIRHGRVRLGIEAPAEVPVHRWEIWERIQRGTLPGNLSEPVDQSIEW